MKTKLAVAILLLMSACSTSRNSGPDSFEKRIADIRAMQADQGAQLLDLQEELRNLVGRIEEVEFRQKNAVGQQAQAHNTHVPSLPAINSGPTTITPIERPVSPLTSSDVPPPIVPLAELEKDEGMAKHLDSQIAQIFRDALYFVRRGEFRQATSMLDQVIGMAQGKEGHAQSLFWKGVSADGVGNNREALEAYSAIIKEYPGLERTRLALLRLASVFIRLGDMPTAKLTLQKLIADAPQSNEAKQAQVKLKDLP